MRFQKEQKTKKRTKGKRRRQIQPHVPLLLTQGAQMSASTIPPPTIRAIIARIVHVAVAGTTRLGTSLFIAGSSATSSVVRPHLPALAISDFRRRDAFSQDLLDVRLDKPSKQFSKCPIISRRGSFFESIPRSALTVHTPCPGPVTETPVTRNPWRKFFLVNRIAPRAGLSGPGATWRIAPFFRSTRTLSGRRRTAVSVYVLVPRLRGQRVIRSGKLGSSRDRCRVDPCVDRPRFSSWRSHAPLIPNDPSVSSDARVLGAFVALLFKKWEHRVFCRVSGWKICVLGTRV